MRAHPRPPPAGGLRPAPDHQHLQVGDRPRAHRRRGHQDRQARHRAVRGRHGAQGLRGDPPHRRAGAQDGPGGAGRLRPLRRRPRPVGGAVRQDRRPRVQERAARAGHLHDGRPALDLPRAQRDLGAALAGAHRRPRAQHRRAGDLPGARHRRAPHRAGQAGSGRPGLSAAGLIQIRPARIRSRQRRTRLTRTPAGLVGLPGLPPC
ncbi:hypothetical protein OF001_U100098 [Pseudomonas sp. OF001]|nr:hypothetical protein OF001_U100098 [Pseudomonas sp. OF001]